MVESLRDGMYDFASKRIKTAIVAIAATAASIATPLGAYACPIPYEKRDEVSIYWNQPEVQSALKSTHQKDSLVEKLNKALADKDNTKLRTKGPNIYLTIKGNEYTILTNKDISKRVETIAGCNVKKSDLENALDAPQTKEEEEDAEETGCHGGCHQPAPQAPPVYNPQPAPQAPPAIPRVNYGQPAPQAPLAKNDQTQDNLTYSRHNQGVHQAQEIQETNPESHRKRRSNAWIILPIAVGAWLLSTRGRGNSSPPSNGGGSGGSNNGGGNGGGGGNNGGGQTGTSPGFRPPNHTGAGDNRSSFR